jgi:hypothetical protein
MELRSYRIISRLQQKSYSKHEHYAPLVEINYNLGWECTYFFFSTWRLTMILVNRRLQSRILSKHIPWRKWNGGGGWNPAISIVSAIALLHPINAVFLDSSPFLFRRNIQNFRLLWWSQANMISQIWGNGFIFSLQTIPSWRFCSCRWLFPCAFKDMSA